MTIETGLSQHTISAIQQVLSQHSNIHQALLYGSRAMGRQRPGSDIDLTLKGEKSIRNDINRILCELDDLLLPYQIDLSYYDDIETAELIDHIDRVGVVFYSR